MWRLLIIATFIGLLGVFMLALHAVKRSCPPEQVVVKYKDRTFEEKQNNPVLPTELYWGMFHRR